MFYTYSELIEIGFKSVGWNVLVSKKCSIYNPGNITIGNNVRIDDYSVLSAGTGGIEIHNNVHIAIFCSLIGNGKITLSDFSGISSRVSIYSSTDDYGGEYLSNPTVPEKFKNIITAPVSIGKHVLIGAGSVILPGITVADYSAVGAMSLVAKSVPSGKIYAGIPARPLKDRKLKLIELETEYLKNKKG